MSGGTAQGIVIIAVMAAATLLTRFLPFILFPAGKKTPKYISFLGTDMHGVHHRAPDSDRALAWIRKKGGDTLARQLSVENPEKIILDERL